MSDEGTWDDDAEEFIKKIGNMAGAYNWIHNKMAFIFTIINYIIHIISMIIVTPLVAGPLTTIADDSDKSEVKITIAIIAVITEILIAIHMYLRLPTKISRHRAAATQYLTIFSRIQKELFKKVKHRLDINKFADDILQEYNECYGQSPGVCKLVIKCYMNMVPEEIDLTVNDLAGVLIVHARSEEVSLNKSRPKVVVGKAKMQYELDRHFIAT